MPGYNYNTWYSKDAIANIIYLNNMIRQYCVTYDSNYETFIVYWEESAIPDIDFRMHNLGLHVLYPEAIRNLVPMNEVEKNMKEFTKRDVEGSKAARNMYAKLLYL